MATAVTHVWRPSRARRVTLDDFMPVPRGAEFATHCTPAWPAKDPSDILDYELDVSAAFAGNDGDAITTLDVGIAPTDPNGLRLQSSIADGPVAVMWFAGGQADQVYSVQVTVGTANGRTLSRAILLPVQSLGTVVPPVTRLQTSDGTSITDQDGNPILVGT